MNEFKFKSRQPFYDKEKHGIKNNTTREIDLNEEKFNHLIYWMINGWSDGNIQIRIIDADVEPYNLEKDSFVRDITDISVYNNLMIITWKHDGGKK